MTTLNIQINLTNGFDSWEVFSRSFTVKADEETLTEMFNETGIVLEEDLTDPNEPYYFQDDEETYQIVLQTSTEDYENEEEATLAAIENAEETILNIKTELGFI